MVIQGHVWFHVAHMHGTREDVYKISLAQVIFEMFMMFDLCKPQPAILFNQELLPLAMPLSGVLWYFRLT